MITVSSSVILFQFIKVIFETLHVKLNMVYICVYFLILQLIFHIVVYIFWRILLLFEHFCIKSYAACKGHLTYRILFTIDKCLFCCITYLIVGELILENIRGVSSR